MSVMVVGVMVMGTTMGAIIAALVAKHMRGELNPDHDTMTLNKFLSAIGIFAVYYVFYIFVLCLLWSLPAIAAHMFVRTWCNRVRPYRMNK